MIYRLNNLATCGVDMRGMKHKCNSHTSCMHGYKEMNEYVNILM